MYRSVALSSGRMLKEAWLTAAGRQSKCALGSCFAKLSTESKWNNAMVSVVSAANPSALNLVGGCRRDYDSLANEQKNRLPGVFGTLRSDDEENLVRHSPTLHSQG